MKALDGASSRNVSLLWPMKARSNSSAHTEANKFTLIIRVGLDIGKIDFLRSRSKVAEPLLLQRFRTAYLSSSDARISRTKALIQRKHVELWPLR